MREPTIHAVLPISFPHPLFSGPLCDGDNPHNMNVHLAHKHSGTSICFLGIICYIPSNGPQLLHFEGDYGHRNGHHSCK